MFNKAVKTESKLRMAIAGPSGSGKTYTALAVATALVPGGRIAVIDTEHGSAAKYADLFNFDVANAAPPYHPDGLIRLINAAVAADYDIIVVDSVSHYWSGAGGVLDIKEEVERKMRNPNSFAAWKDVTPLHQRMVEALVGAAAHVIVTMRSKQDYILVEKNGRMVPQKVGMAPVQRDGFEYEFDVMMDIDIEHVGRVQKTRCPALVDGAFVKPGADVAGILREWLTGASPEQAAPPIVFTPPVPTPPAAPAKPATAKPARPAAPPMPDDPPADAQPAVPGVGAPTDAALQALRGVVLPDYRQLAIDAKAAGEFDYAAYMVLRNGVYDSVERVAKTRQSLVPDWTPTPATNEAMLLCLEVYRDKRAEAQGRGSAAADAHTFAKIEALRAYSATIS